MFTILDGSAIAYRVWYTKPMSSARQANSTDEELVDNFGGLFARLFLNQLFAIQKKINRMRPEFNLLIMCWDIKGSKLNRKRIYPEYCANRSSRNISKASIYPLLNALRDTLGRVHKRYGIVNAEFEADDLIAVFTRIASEANIKSCIVTRDSDLFQLVDENVMIYNPFDDEIYSHDNHPFPVLPDEYPLYKACCGDKADNWPGVVGIGPKSFDRFLHSDQFQKHKYTVDLGLRLVTIPLQGLDLTPAYKLIFTALEDETKPDWDCFLNTFDIDRDLAEETYNLP